jgi:NAD(P)H-nitrite reductase large subunit
MSKIHVIIGAAAAGMGVLTKLRMLDPTSTIIVISDEAELPYNKCLLADFLSGNKAEEAVMLKSKLFFQTQGIAFKRNVRVNSIDPHQKTITVDDGMVIPYDTLFIGTGSSPFIPAIPGIEYAYPFHTLAHAQQLRALIKQGTLKNACIIGAGLSGLECADSLRLLGVKPIILEAVDRLMPRHFDVSASSMLEHNIAAQGGVGFTNSYVRAVIKKEEGYQVIVNSDTTFLVDLVVIATGLRPNSRLAQEAGLALCGNHILVDDYLQTSDPYIWAGGDCCVVKDQLTGSLMGSCLWPDASNQGMIAAHGMAGQPKKYPGAAIITSSTFFSTQIAACGPVAYDADGYDVVIKQRDATYQKIILNHGRVKGFLLVGDTSLMPLLKRVLLTQELFNKNMLL